MAWVVPKFSKAVIDKAGQALIVDDLPDSEKDQALEILNNWRSSHSFPLNTFQVRLRRESSKIDSDSLVAQRLKRASSVISKLKRFPKMQLARMQDLGGCRAVFKNASLVELLYSRYKKSGILHHLVNEKNYIENPKESGYRGIHLVYRYFSDKKETYNGLQIEIQLRTRLQHAWATAVETVGIFLQHSLKSSEGPDQWLKFFTLMGSVFAKIEKRPLVPGTPNDDAELKREVKRMAKELKVVKKLAAYGRALQVLERPRVKGFHYFLLWLKPVSETLRVKAYKKDQLKEATEEYLRIEKSLPGDKGAEAVLVAADSVESLKVAYPNYFLDTTVFLRHLQKYIR